MDKQKITHVEILSIAQIIVAISYSQHKKSFAESAEYTMLVVAFYIKLILSFDSNHS